VHDKMILGEGNNNYIADIYGIKTLVFSFSYDPSGYILKL
jgi:hypothetical protein